MKRFLCGLTALCCAVLGKEADIDNVIGDSGDDAILKAMKSSGVVNAMEEELSGGLTTQDKDMLVSFVEEYNADNNKDVTPKNVVDIVGKIAKNKKPNMPQIFVQLSPVLDLLHTLETGSKRIDIIIGQYAEVLEDRPEWINLTLEQKHDASVALVGPKQRHSLAKVYVLTTYYGCLILVGVFGNLLTSWVISKSLVLQTPPNFYIFNLAIVDLIKS